MPESITKRVGKEFRFLTTNQYGNKWVTSNEYTLVTRCWDADQNTSFGLWIFNSVYWDYLVTINYPYYRARFNNGTMAFMDNYESTQLTDLRKMVTHGGWKRSTSGWNYFHQGTFNVAATGGVSNGTFYLESKLNLPTIINSANTTYQVKLILIWIVIKFSHFITFFSFPMVLKRSRSCSLCPSHHSLQHMTNKRKHST